MIFQSKSILLSFDSDFHCCASLTVRRKTFHPSTERDFLKKNRTIPYEKKVSRDNKWELFFFCAYLNLQTIHFQINRTCSNLRQKDFVRFLCKTRKHSFNSTEHEFLFNVFLMISNLFHLDLNRECRSTRNNPFYVAWQETKKRNFNSKRTIRFVFLLMLTLTSRFNFSMKIFFWSIPSSMVRFPSIKSLSFKVGHGFSFSFSVAVRSTVEPW